jgi:hypothetical protein
MKRSNATDISSMKRIKVRMEDGEDLNHEIQESQKLNQMVIPRDLR